MPRPTGVTILGVLAIIGGAGSIALGLLFMLGSDFIAHRLVGLPMVFFAGIATVGGLFFLTLGVFELVIGIGLLNLANWARILTMVFAAIGLVAAALGALGALAHVLPVLMMRRLIAGAIDALILWYLSQPHVKRAFGAPIQIPIAPGAPPAPPMPGSNA
jgi:hypothetical protein